MPFPIEAPRPFGDRPELQALYRYLDALAQTLNCNFDELDERLRAVRTKEEAK